jgi:hypothetical protein
MPRLNNSKKTHKPADASPGIGHNGAPAGERWYRAFEVYKDHCPPSTFYLMAARGEIELFKVGRRTYLRENWEQILTRLAQRKPAAAAD